MTEEKIEQAAEQAAEQTEAPKEETPAVNPLERSLELSVPAAEVRTLSQKYLRNYAKDARMPGFRKGHVPMAQVEQMYGMRAFDQALNELVGQAWSKAAQESGLAVACQPRIEALEGEKDSEDMKFKAVFEVFPEIVYPDFKTLLLKRYSCTVDDAAVQKTLDVMARQRVTYGPLEEDRPAQKDDRVTVNFRGTKDGVEFAGGKADGFQFVLGDGRMLADFDAAVTGMKKGEKKTFDMTFPENYGPAELNGAKVQFEVELTNIELAHIPEITDDFAKSLGEESVESMRAAIRTNLEREVEFRLTQKTEAETFEALAGALTYPIPTTIVAQERHAMAEQFAETMKQRGAKVSLKDFPESMFQENAEKRVRLGLFTEDLVAKEKLQATNEQIAERAKVIASSYENPAEVEQYLTTDRNSRMNLGAQVQQKNVCDWLLAHADTTDEAVEFDKVMSGAF